MMRSVARTLFFATENEGIIKWDCFCKKEESIYYFFYKNDPHLMIPLFSAAKNSVRATDRIIKWNGPLNDNCVCSSKK